MCQNGEKLEFHFSPFFSLEFNCTYAMAFTYVEWYAYTWNTRAMYIYGTEESRYAEYQMNSELNICIKLLLWISKRILSSYSLFLFFRLATLFFSIEFSFHFSVSFLHTFLAIRLPLRRRGRHSFFSYAQLTSSRLTCKLQTSPQVKGGENIISVWCLDVNPCPRELLWNTKNPSHIQLINNTHEWRS